jgi:predicted nucleic acid-binding protein
VIVADASAVLEILLNTLKAAIFRDRLFGREESICAPYLIDIEVAQVLRRYCARTDITAERGQEAIDDFRSFPITRYPHEIFLRRIWELRNSLTAYDAVYISLAEALHVPLITSDSRLAGSHGHEAVVEILI